MLIVQLLAGYAPLTAIKAGRASYNRMLQRWKFLVELALFDPTTTPCLAA